MEIKVTKETIRGKLEELDRIDKAIARLREGRLSEDRMALVNTNDVFETDMTPESFKIWMDGAREAKLAATRHLQAQRIALMAELNITTEV